MEANAESGQGSYGRLSGAEMTDFNSVPGWCLYCAYPEAENKRLREENRRMRIAFDTINRISEDMKDEEKRLGPTRI